MPSLASSLKVPFKKSSKRKADANDEDRDGRPPNIRETDEAPKVDRSPKRSMNERRERKERSPKRSRDERTERSEVGGRAENSELGERPERKDSAERKERRDRKETGERRERSERKENGERKEKKEKKPAVAAPQQPMILVTVNDRLGTKKAVPCFGSDTVGQFKIIVASMIGRAPHEIMLKRQGERPFKDHITLADYGVSNNVQLDLEVDTGD